MTRRELLAFAATAGFAADHLNRAPFSRDNLNVKLPEAVPVKLSNGVTVLAIEDTRLPIATVRFQMEDAGEIYATQPGLAVCTAEMLNEGGAGRSGKQLADEAARLGATLSSTAAAAAEAAYAEGSGLTSHFAEWLELLTGMVLRPSFSADEFSMLRQRWLVRIRLRETQPSVLADDGLQRVTCGSHPAAITSPTAESLGKLTPEMLAAWHRERYAPAKTIVTCIGRVRPSAVASQLEKLLGGWKTVATNPAPLPPLADSPRRIVLIDRPGAPQTELAIGGLLMERRDPDFIAVGVLNGVLGGGISSRLFRILRDQKGYSFNPGSVYSGYRFRGFWRIKAGVRTDATGDSIAIILEQLRRLCDEPIPTAELEASKSNVVGNFALRLEQPAQVMNQSYLRYRYGFSADYWERFPAKVNAVSASETQALAQKYLAPDRAHIVAVGDGARIRAVLEKLGKVEVQGA
jgi:predicted Zn-dependent peptidase